MKINNENSALQKIKKNSFLRFSKKVLLLFLVVFSSNLTQAEGTKQVSPTDNDWAILNIRYGFAGYGTAGTNRGIAFEVLDAAEEVYFAFSSLAYGNYRNLSTSPYEYRIMDSGGSIVYGPFTINSGNVNGNNYNNVVAGPDLGGGGYDVSNPMYNFSPSAPGTYYLEFRITTPISPGGSFHEGPAWWDISVADAGGNIKEGRLWSKNWSLRTTCDNCADIFSQPFNGEIFVLTNDGFVHYLDFKGSGFRGLTFALAFNKTGPGSSGNLVLDRQSVNGSDSSNPEFQIFFSDPDPDLYIEPSIGGIQSGPDLINSGQCDTLDMFCFEFDITQPGSIELILDFEGGDSIFTYGSRDLSLFKTLRDTPGIFEVCVNWDRKDGLGNSVDLTAFIPTIVSYSQGNINFMLYDVEYNNPGFEVEVIHPASAAANDFFSYDDTQLDINDNDANLDLDNNPATGTNPPLFDFIGCASPCHIWNRNTTSQSLGFGESNTINTWWSGNVNYVNLAMRPFCRFDNFLVEKTVSQIVPAASGTPDHFDVTFDIILKNEGTTMFDSIRLTDDFVGNFGAGFISTVGVPTVSAFAGNPILPSIGNYPAEIFSGNDGLIDIGEAVKVSFTVELNPVATGSWQILSNQAFGLATNEFSSVVTDLSDDPADPTSSDDPTLVRFPKLGLSKRITNLPAPAAVSGNPNSFDVEYELIVENLGDVSISNISLVDSIENQMGNAFIDLVVHPNFQGNSSAVAQGAVNVSFTGRGTQTELLNGTGTLEPGENLIIRYTAEIAASQTGAIYVTPGVVSNQAKATGDFASFSISDLSDTGMSPADNTAPVGTNPGAEGDTGGTNDPTLFSLPAIPEICNNMLDDDLDGLTDCDDDDCGVTVNLAADCDTGISVLNPQSGDTYVWRFEGSLLVGITGDSFANSDNLEGNFSVEVTNTAGCSETEIINLECCEIPGTPLISGGK